MHGFKGATSENCVLVLSCKPFIVAQLSGYVFARQGLFGCSAAANSSMVLLISCESMSMAVPCCTRVPQCIWLALLPDSETLLLVLTMEAAAPAKETAMAQPPALSHGSELLPETLENYFEANKRVTDKHLFDMFH